MDSVKLIVPFHFIKVNYQIALLNVQPVLQTVSNAETTQTFAYPVVKINFYKALLVFNHAVRDTISIQAHYNVKIAVVLAKLVLQEASAYPVYNKILMEKT